MAISGPESSKSAPKKTPKAMKAVPPGAGGIELEAMQPPPPQGPACPPSGVTVTANVVALDQPFTLNRMGAAMPQGMIFALLEDIVPSSGSTLTAGNVVLRIDKRPRPLVLRMSCGDSMTVNFWNLLSTKQVNSLQPVTRNAGVHAMGMQMGNQSTGGIANDGSNVGANTSSLVAPLSGSVTPASPQITYTFFAQYEGTFLLYSTGATFGDQSGHSGQLAEGLFGAVNVAPPGGEAYRSQITNQELQYALPQSGPKYSPVGQPLIDYQAHYPPGATINGRNVSCLPVLKIIDVPQTYSAGTCSAPQGDPHIFYSDLTAIITGPNAGVFNGNGPWFQPIPPPNSTTSPNRTQPYREFTIIYHDLFDAQQAFYNFFSPPTGQQNPWPDISNVLGAGTDLFGINYGTGGIGAEIVANRLGVGPMWNCVECKFEEFFLSAWAVGDPSMVVDVPANVPAAYINNVGSNPNVVPPNSWEAQMENLNVNNSPLPSTYTPQAGAKATLAYFADDPSNVYHSYLNDHVKFRILHAGSLLTHVHHQHAHQWLHTPNDPNGSYLDSQLISPGSAFTLEVDYGGSGNRNKTLGDSIFHCHFYAHFADGMWGMWRVHDVLESGTQLDNKGRATSNARALPDGEISTGTPIPSIVPVPTQAMAPLPAYAHIVGGQINLQGTCQNNQVDGMQVVTGNQNPFANGTCTNGQKYYGQVVNGNQFLIAPQMQNPGYPFFIPGQAGHRPPHPPLDFACKTQGPVVGGKPTCLEQWDGGLPRHIITSGNVGLERHNLWDFTKNNGYLNAVQLPEEGTASEKAAMAYNGQRVHSSYTPNNQQASFIVNGLPNGPQSGAPFADPAVNDDGTPAGKNKRVYKAADIEMDAVFSKKGWHHPQERLITLWDDVLNTINGKKAPEPFFFRANSSDDVIEFWQTNLVPDYYQLDDFQVQTPTDIVGQHIHLVKFDVLASDGAANGFNYEDGTFSPEEVQARYAAIKAAGGKWNHCPGCAADLRPPQPPPNEIAPTYSCPANGPYQPWCGAQTTIQRWYPDLLQGCFWPPCTSNNGDRTLRTVFTHDHFGPSTHQQAGLYAGLLVEPQGSTWWSPDGKTQYGTNPSPRTDGGPTSWEANILAGTNQSDSYREFALEFQDLALTYEGTSTTTPVSYPTNPPPPENICDNAILKEPGAGLCTKNPKPWGWVDCANAVNAPALTHPSVGSKDGSNCASQEPLVKFQPQIISGNLGDGTAVMNYRNEPLQFRVYDPNCNQYGCSAGHNPSTAATDLSQAFSSLITRNDPCLNVSPPLGTPVNQNPPPTGSPCTYASPPANPQDSRVYPGPFTGANAGDPYTPLLRAYMNDRVQVRLLVGAHLAPHSYGMHGLKWYFEPSNSNSGYRDNQSMGISEHFELQFTSPPSVAPQTDYLYGGFGLSDLSAGIWGLFRSYNMKAPGSQQPTGLAALPNNPNMGATMPATAGCPANAGNPRQYYAAAINVPGGLNYNSTVKGSTIGNAPSALVYVQTDSYFNPLQSGTPTEPLVLRANAGECIQVTLKNNFTTSNSLFTTADSNATATCIVQPKGTAVDPDCATSLFPSYNVGLHTQVVSYDVSAYDGMPVGTNQPIANTPTPVPPGGTATYSWYAGTVAANGDGTTTGTPVEFGSVNLLTSDPMEQQPYAMVGALIIEPADASCTSDSKNPTNFPLTYCQAVNGSHLTADITSSSAGNFREFVSILQDNVYLQWTQNSDTLTASDSINFTSNPMPYRFCGNSSGWNSVDIQGAFSNTPVSSDNPPENCPTSAQIINTDPPTVFQANVGTPVRFRMVHPDGYGGVPDNTITLHGHPWAEEPYLSNSSAIASNSSASNTNPNSQYLGSRDGFGPQNHFDIVVPKAGGENGVCGDYLLESFHPQQFTNGAWGLFRVSGCQGAPPPKPFKMLAKRPKKKAVVRPARKHADPAERFLPRRPLKPVLGKTANPQDKSNKEKKH